MPTVHAPRYAVVLNLLFAIAVAPASPVTSLADPPRVRQSFDFDWRFSLGDVDEGQATDFDDEAWRPVHLPHDWSVEQPFSPDHASGTGYLPGGVGWYRKTFQAPEAWQGRDVKLYFDGVHRNSTVWINGEKVGERPYGYIPFSVRLTPHLRMGQENVVAVRVAREEIADSRWYPGSGIYRHTWLTVTDPVHLQQWGTFVTTPRVTAERADIAISNTVDSLADAEAAIRVVTQVVGPNGQTLSTQSTDASLAAGAEKTIAHWHVAAEPALWSVDSPTLYTAVSQVFRDGELIDQTRTTFGIRSAYFDANNGFFLNGEPMKIKGLCLHHDAGVVGAAVPDRVLERRLRLVKDLGANAVRCAHNPMASELYEICDRIGLLVMDEAFDEWELGKRKWVKGRNVGRAERYGYNEHFEQWAERDVADMVRRGRNHPSIILWSIGNEIDYPGDPYAHPEFFDPAAPPVDEGSPSATRLAVVAPKLIAAVKRHDPTRPVTMALSNMPASNGVGLANMLDVAGYNYQEQFYDQDHADFPGRVIYGSENGKSRNAWRAVVDNDYISSIYLWSGFDFLGEAGEWPNRGSRSGVFDTRGFLKPRSWYYRAEWNEAPAVRLFAGKWPEPQEGQRRQRRGLPMADRPRLWKGTPGERTPLLITTNCDEVRLTLNGAPVEARRLDDPRRLLAFARFAAGELRIEGLRDGEVVAVDSLATPGPAARIELIADREALAADGADVVHVEARLVDERGAVVVDGDLAASFRVNGAGRLLGVDNGDQNDTTDLNSPAKKFRDGRLLVLAQSSRQPGEILIEAQAEGLPKAEVRVAVGD